MNRPQHITVAGETYSANLGDGVIADCIAHLFRIVEPAIEVVHADISGLTRRPDAEHSTTAANFLTPRSRLGALLPRDNRVRWHLVRRRRCLAVWRARLDGASALVIGGGQLLMDNDLDFPLKINGIAAEASKRGLPIHFLACGVNPNWSPAAARLFADALRSAHSISVRDDASAGALQRLVPNLTISVSADPAIWAASVYPRAATALEPPVIGLGLMSVAAVNRRLRGELTEAGYHTLWLGIIEQVHARGYAMRLFTNGGDDDHETALRVAQQAAQQLGIVCEVAPRPRTPVDLAETLSAHSAIIATRLHATIIATSYLIPTVGLSWDKKVRAFFEQTGRPDLALDLLMAQPGRVVDALSTAMTTGINPEVIDATRASALAGVESIVRQLG